MKKLILAFLFACLIAESVPAQGIAFPCPKTLQYTINSPGGPLYVYDRVNCVGIPCDESPANQYAFYLKLLDATELGCKPNSGPPCVCKVEFAPMFVGGGNGSDYMCSRFTTISAYNGRLQKHYLHDDNGTPFNPFDDKFFISIKSETNGNSGRFSYAAARLNARPILPIGESLVPCTTAGNVVTITASGEDFDVIQFTVD